MPVRVQRQSRHWVVSALLLPALAEPVGGCGEKALGGSTQGRKVRGAFLGAGNGSISFPFRVSLSRCQIRVLEEPLRAPSDVEALLHLFVQMFNREACGCLARGLRSQTGSRSLPAALLPFI